MSDTKTMFALLRQSANALVVDAIEKLLHEGADHELARVNVMAFAAQHGFNEEDTIAAFLHASRIGLFDLSWNVLCPGCGGVLDVGESLKNIHAADYNCALCAADYEPTLDEMVEVTFTVHPRARRIAAHDPDHLPVTEYFRQTFWSSGLDVPDDTFKEILHDVIIDSLELPAGDKAIMSLILPAEFVIVFEPVSHSVQFIDVKGEPTRERQALSVIINRTQQPTGTIEMRPGPLRLSIENRTERRALPTIFLANDKLHDMMMRRRPFLTAKRLLTNQTFRDMYHADTLDINQRLKITSLTFLFTDLKGSTELYERVGDLVAFDMVRAHFKVLHQIVAAEAGAVVKTIGDAVMATFPTPDRAMAAALHMREAMRKLNAERGGEDLLLKIGIHEGPCLAVTLNERQDYFGSTVNIAARVQGLATSHSIFATGSVVENAKAAELLAAGGHKPTSQNRALRGIADAMAVYEIP